MARYEILTKKDRCLIHYLYFFCMPNRKPKQRGLIKNSDIQRITGVGSGSVSRIARGKG